MRRRRGVSAWLVTWEHVGEHARPLRRVAAVLKPRLPADCVLYIVEVLYEDTSLAPSDQVSILRNPAAHPYPAAYDSIDGIPWQGRILGGHNPYLLARKVKNLRVEDDAAGAQAFAWDELPPPPQLS